MNTPPLLLGAALVFWGWQTGHYLLGGLAALALEGAKLLHWQCELSQDDYHRLGDLSVGMLLLVGLYFSLAEEIVNSPFLFLQWLPMMGFPIMAAQYFGPRPRVAYSSFFWVFRKRIPLHPPDLGLNICYPYLAVCLLATSAIKPQNLQFYFGFSLLVAWALWAVRPRRSAPALWLGLLAALIAAGYDSQRRLHELQGFLDGRLVSWLTWGRKDLDDTQTRTAIGRIGRLKLSGRIVLRLTTDGASPPPPLLRQATYVIYRNAAWLATRRELFALPPATNDLWTLLPGAVSPSSVTIAGYLKGGQGALALPPGSAEIRDLPTPELKTNRLAVVGAENGPGFYNLKAHYGPGATLDSPPDVDDLALPETERAAFEQVATELGLAHQPPAEALRKVERFFQANFHYSSYLSADVRDPAGRLTPLGWFLLHRRSGHCEYFASATVLLLRAAGIAARYATGYSVQERAHGRQYVVRERHAHAWCLAWRSDRHRWEDFDTTPADWSAVEERNASWLQPWSDFWSWLWYEFSKWRYSKAGLRSYLLWLTVPLMVTLIWRVIFMKRKAPRRPQPTASITEAVPGSDSDFYRIEQRLLAAGLVREAGETLAHWLQRLSTTPACAWTSLAPILHLHYRYRFDPNGLDHSHRNELKVLVTEWLAQYEARVGRSLPSPPT